MAGTREATETSALLQHAPGSTADLESGSLGAAAAPPKADTGGGRKRRCCPPILTLAGVVAALLLVALLVIYGVFMHDWDCPAGQFASEATEFQCRAIPEVDTSSCVARQDLGLPAEEEVPIKGADPVKVLRDGRLTRVVWMYWGQGIDAAPQSVKRALANWKHFAAQSRDPWEVRLITEKNAKDYLGTDWREVEAGGYKAGKMSFQQTADMVRVRLLDKFGGVYTDATTFATQNLDWIDTLMKANESTPAEVGGFDHPGFSHGGLRDRQPVFENWFIASAARAQLTCRWMKQFEVVLVAGPRYFNQVVYEKWNFKKIPEGLREYLSQHVALQVVLQREQARLGDGRTAPQALKLNFWSAFDGPFKLLSDANWDSQKAVNQMMDDKALDLPKYFVKLRGDERKPLEEALQKRKPHPQSLAEQLLGSGIGQAW
jgi:hypothetical protein